MHKIDDINSILNAVHEINSKIKKKPANITVPKRFIPKLNQDLIIPLDLDKIIREAEEYKKNLRFKSPQANVTQNKNDTIKSENYIKTLEQVQAQIIDDLYSKFTKKIKKNTLKIIFNLNLKIKDLEKKLDNSKIKKEQSTNKDKLILKDEFVIPSGAQDLSALNLNKVLSKNKNILKNDIATSLIIQDSTISALNEKIKIFKTSEEKLRFQIIDLEQDKIILLKNTEKLEELKDSKNLINITKQILKSIYAKVEKQKKIFLDLKNHSIKIVRDYNFYKENYEKLIVENNDIKKKFLNTKQQVEAFEEIKKELSLAFENFNNVLSKNSIIKIHESFSKINTNLFIPSETNKNK